MNETNDLRELPTEQLVPPRISLRPVKQNSVEYLELKDSIAEKGILNSISARPCNRFPGKYEIIDGMYRWTCAKEIGLQTIPTVIKHDITDMDVLVLQIQANAIRPTTYACDFARQLKRIQQENPQITIAQIASVMVSKSPSWVQRQLGLLLLQPDQQKMVNRGEICLKKRLHAVENSPLSSHGLHRSGENHAGGGLFRPDGERHQASQGIRSSRQNGRLLY